MLLLAGSFVGLMIVGLPVAIAMANCANTWPIRSVSPYLISNTPSGSFLSDGNFASASVTSPSGTFASASISTLR